MKSLNKFTFAALILLMASLAHSATTRYAEIRTSGTLQPDTTNYGIYQGTGTVVIFYSSTATIRTNLNVNRITETGTDISNNQVIFSSAGILSGDAGLTYNGVTDNLTVSTITVSTAIITGGSITGAIINTSSLTATSATIAGGSITGLSNFTATQGTVTVAGHTTVNVSGSILNAQGSAGAPSYSLTGDSDTGMYSTGGNNLSFAVNGIRQVSLNPGSLSVNGSLPGNQFQFLSSSGTAALPAYSQNVAGGTDTGLYFPDGGTVSLSADGADRFVVNSTSANITVPAYIKGTTTNDSAATGQYGEYASSATATFTNFPATNNYGSLARVVLTAGDWDVYATVYALANGATVPNSVYICIGTVDGDDSTGCVDGQTRLLFAPPSVTADAGYTIPPYRFSISGTTTYYLKYRTAYTVATPKASGIIQARRAR